MNRVKITTVLLACFVSLMTLAIAKDSVSKNEAKPNFVFFLVDDFKRGTLSGMGGKFHETPNIKAFLESGKWRESVEVQKPTPSSNHDPNDIEVKKNKKEVSVQ